MSVESSVKHRIDAFFDELWKQLEPQIGPAGLSRPHITGLGQGQGTRGLVRRLNGWADTAFLELEVAVPFDRLIVRFRITRRTTVPVLNAVFDLNTARPGWVSAIEERFHLGCPEGEPRENAEVTKNEASYQCSLSIPFEETLPPTDIRSLSELVQSFHSVLGGRVLRLKGDYSIGVYSPRKPSAHDEYLAGLEEMYGQKPTKTYGNLVPKRTEHTVAVHARSKRLADRVLKHAKGCCELCGKQAPFLTPAGRPFLEVHHVKRLADDGPDTWDNAVALCPNCHRALHYAADVAALHDKLFEQVPRLRRW